MADVKITIPKEVTGKTIQFGSISELQNWIQQEQQAYHWVSELRRNFSSHIWNHVTAQFQAVQQQINAINQNISRTQPFDGHIDAIHSWFESTYPKKKLFLSTSAEFKAVLDLKVSDPIKAATFLGHLIKLPHLYQNGIETIEMLEASHEYFQYANGLSKKDLSAERQALEELKKEWDIHFTTYRDQEDNLKTEFETTKTNFDKYFQDTQKNVADHLKKHTEDLEELKKTYDQYMALKAPVEYWKNKRQKHRDNASLLKKWSIGTGATGAILFTLSALYFLSTEPVSYFKVAIFLFLGTLFFWAMRVLVKLMLSNVHLEGDAHEREVMCQTYLALLRDKTGLEENDKKLILTTLFRPSSSGIMGEDGIPPGFYDVMTKIASK